MVCVHMSPRAYNMCVDVGKKVIEATHTLYVILFFIYFILCIDISQQNPCFFIPSSHRTYMIMIWRIYGNECILYFLKLL